MNKRTIYGPPGTGKTTFLINLIEEELKTIAPDKVAYVSYTKKGTYEGVERAMEAFKLKGTDVPYFRTLHSLCFRAVGADREGMIDKKHYRLFSKVTGIPFTGYYTEDRRSPNDLYIHAISMRAHNKKLFDSLAAELDPQQLHYILVQYEAMKKQLELRDFDDLLLEYLEFGEPLDIKVAFVDEAQDLTPLQWRVVVKMFSNAERIYVAGDDDQAVYSWAGADVGMFMRFSKDQKVLSHSYRLPQKVLGTARNVLKDIKVRKDKKFTANESVGSVDHAGKLTDIELKGGELILGRTNHLLESTAEELRNQGLRYTHKGKSSVAKTVASAINAYILNQRGEDSSIATFKDYFVALNDQPWHVNLAYKPETNAYLERALHDKRTPVRLETFHSSKGSEAEHVIVLTDITTRVAKDAHTDDELRCLYVALTRSKSKLTIVAPSNKEHYPLHYFKEKT